MSSTKKRPAASSEPKEKKEKKEKSKKAAPKKEEDPDLFPVDDKAGDKEEVAAETKEKDPNAPPKKKRKVVRFNPHNPSDYLDLNRYWKNHESLRNGLLKAHANEAEAEEKGDKDAADIAAASVARYTGVLQRLESRRQDVIGQLKATADLLAYGTVAEPLITRLVGAFSSRPAPTADEVAAMDTTDSAPAAPVDASA